MQARGTLERPETTMGVRSAATNPRSGMPGLPSYPELARRAPPQGSLPGGQKRQVSPTMAQSPFTGSCGDSDRAIAAGRKRPGGSGWRPHRGRNLEPGATALSRGRGPTENHSHRRQHLHHAAAQSTERRERHRRSARPAYLAVVGRAEKGGPPAGGPPFSVLSGSVLGRV